MTGIAAMGEAAYRLRRSYGALVERRTIAKGRMDLLQLLRSFGELLFEVLSWIIYYPLTLWRVVRHPLKMVSYSDHEQRDAEGEQYTDALSPPLLLLIIIALMHGLELATRAPTIKATTAAARAITASDENLIVARAFLFGLLPLFAAWRYVAARGLPMERKHLRPPFYGQCYLAAPYALLLPLAITVGRLDIPGALAIGCIAAVAATAWYLTVQILQFRSSLSWTTGRSVLLALRAFAEALIAFVLAALIISGLP